MSDLFRGKLSWRRLTVLVENLPADSMTRLAMDPENAIWGIDELLLVAVLDQLRVANWQRGGGKGPRPKPIPRPGATPAKSEARHVGDTRHMRPEDVSAYLRQFAPRHEDGNGG